MAEENDVDLAKVQEFIRGQMEALAPDLIQRELATRQPVTQQQGQLSQEDQAKLELQKMLEPFIAPRINAAQLAAADAKDSSTFYSNPENLAMQDEVEKMFKEQMDLGRALPRADIKKYLLGREYEADPIKFTEKQTERRKAQVKSAEGATDIGFGALERAKSDPIFGNGNVWTMPLEDLEKALQGVSF